MILDFSQLVLFGFLTASIHWLIARSEIAKPFWSRVTGWAGKLLACPACCGFWLGGIVAGTGWAVPVSLYDDSLRDAWSIHALMGALLGVVVTPIVEGLLLWGLERSAIAVDVPPEDNVAPERPRVVSDDTIVTPVERPR